MNYNPKKQQLFENALVGILMAAILGGLAYLVATWLIPWGCQTRASYVSSLWGCIIPGITLFSSVFLALALPLLFYFSTKKMLQLLNHWFIVALIAAIFSQMALSTATILATMPLHAGLTYWEVAFIPHGLGVGFICGAFFFLMRSFVKKYRGRPTDEQSASKAKNSYQR